MMKNPLEVKRKLVKACHYHGFKLKNLVLAKRIFDKAVWIQKTYFPPTEFERAQFEAYKNRKGY